MDVSQLQQAISDYGYWALFVGTFMEGETTFLLGGVMARQGFLDPVKVALAALAGGFLGDQFFFLLGRWRGAWVLNRFPKLARKAAMVRRRVRRHATPLVLLSRFLVGFRMVVPLACGISRVQPWRFVLLNLVSALAWTVVFAGLGYSAGGWLVNRLETIQGLGHLAVLVAAVFLAVLAVGHQIRKRYLASDPPGEEPEPEV